MKGSPAKLGTIQGTSGHTSALKAAMDEKFNMPKPKMSKTTAHGQMNDAKADFKADQEMYNKAMGKKGKTAEDYMNEGFSQREADQMEKDGGVSGNVDSPNKLFTKASRENMKNKRAMKKEARSERKQMSKDAKADRKEARNARAVKRQDEKTAKKKAKLDERTRKASMTRAEKKAEKAETRKARAASFREKASKFLDDVAYGQALQKGDASMISALRKKKDHDPTASENKLKGDNNASQNKTAGINAKASKAKTSNEINPNTGKSFKDSKGNYKSSDRVMKETDKYKKEGGSIMQEYNKNKKKEEEARKRRNPLSIT